MTCELSPVDDPFLGHCLIEQIERHASFAPLPTWSIEWWLTTNAPYGLKFHWFACFQIGLNKASVLGHFFFIVGSIQANDHD